MRVSNFFEIQALRLKCVSIERGPVGYQPTSDQCAANWCTNFNCSLGFGFGEGLGLWLSSGHLLLSGNGFVSYVETKIYSIFYFIRPSGAFCLRQNAQRAALRAAGQATSGKDGLGLGFWDVVLE